MSEPTTTAAASTAPTEAELEAAYTQALQTATKRTRRNSPLRETAIDAAADSVIWARDNWNPARDTGGGFLAFAGRSAATWVHRAIVTATRSNALEIAQDAINCLKRLRVDDPKRSRALEMVSDYIKHHS